MTRRRASRPQQPVVRDEHGTVHRPLTDWPLRLRPDGHDGTRNGYSPADPTEERQWHRYPTGETLDEWRDRRAAAELELLRDALHGLDDLTDLEERHLGHLARIADRNDVVIMASLLDRVYRLGLARGRGQQ